MQTSFSTTGSTILPVLWRMNLYLVLVLLCIQGMFVTTVFAADRTSVKTGSHSVTININADDKEQDANTAHSVTTTNNDNDDDEASHDEDNHHEDDRDVVQILGDALLMAGEDAHNVVSVVGSSTAEGNVSHDIVSILGDIKVRGTVDHDSVAVFGSNDVNNKVGNDVVAVLGDIKLGSQAEVDHDVVSIGGTVTRDPGSIVHGAVHTIGPHLGLGRLGWLHSWIHNCLLKGRLLAFVPDLSWAWSIAFTALFVYLLTALLFPRAVNRCVTVLEESPGHSALTALLAVIGMPLFILLLCITVIGIIAIPFIGMALMIAAFFGKVVILAWLGRRLIKGNQSSSAANHPALSVLIGGIILMLLYVIPIVGLIAYKLVGFMGFGVVLYALLQEIKSRRDNSTGGPGGINNNPADLADAGPSIVHSASTQAKSGSSESSANDTTAMSGSAIELTSLPRAGFWIRMVALLIDSILVGAIVNFALHDSERFGIDLHHMTVALLVIYGIAMWKLKGATVGDIIFKLQVIRADGREIDWPTAVVRGLSCFLSLTVIFLGFLWIAFDTHKQAWHDKIAGTLVVRHPNGMSLV